MNPIELAAALVRIPSESSDPVATPETVERAAAELLAQRFRAAGFFCETPEVEVAGRREGRCNFVARWPRPGAPKLWIVAHLDTVSARGMEAPFSGEVRDGDLLGRGACDDKGPLAAAAAAILSLKASGRECAFDLLFAATADEERSFAGAEVLLATETAAGRGRFDLCLVLEPTCLRAVKAHKGVARFELATRGRACHSARPERGENAILRMLPVVADLEAFGRELAAEREDPVLGRASLALTGIRGGVAANIIPDLCEATVDIRLLPGTDPRALEARLRALCAGRAEIRPVLLAAGIGSEPAGPVWEAFRAALGAGGLPTDPIGVDYCTDASHLAAGGPCLVWGPGDIAQAHARDERIAVGQLERAATLLGAFLSGGR